MNYRLATLEDFDAWFELRVLMQAEVCPMEGRKSQDIFRDATRRYYIEHIPRGSLICAMADWEGRLVASSALCVYHRMPTLNGTGCTGYVSNIYTRPEFRKKGIAKEVLALLLREGRARGVEKFHLGATPEGQGLYEQRGFQVPAWPYMETR